MVKFWYALVTAGALLAAPAQAQSADQNELIRRGEYLAIAGDCGACHTEEGKAPFSGGHAIVSPLGTIFSTNITPSKQAGIGDYTEAEFAAALRKGIRADGSRLYPAMPYTAYARLTDEDVSALYAYFMQGVKPVDERPPQTALPFPFNLRISMAVWDLLFTDDRVYQPDPTQSAVWNRGAYLVQGLAHCSTCHTPRNLLMAEQQDNWLKGASLGTWYAPDITAPALQAKPYWTQQMLAEYLLTGHAANGATAGGPMREAIDKSFSRMTAEDRQAIATYLLPADATVTKTPEMRGLQPVAGDDLPQTLATLSQGEQIYRDNCASCHNLSGQGQNGLPALQNHPVLNKPVADNVAMAILAGIWPEKGQGMIGFAGSLNDEQIAAVTNYVMQDMGHSQVQITPERVNALRAGGDTSPLKLLARFGMGAAVVALMLILFRIRKKRAAKV